MNDIPITLRDLATPAPGGLARSTLFLSGAADEVASVDSPFGPVWIAWSSRGITGLTPRFACDSFDEFATEHRRHTLSEGHLPNDLEQRVIDALERGDTIDVPVDMRGLGEFQVSVLQACATIQPGTVRSYGWIADELANPGAVRAVGTALGKNPIPLIVPCHRVVRSDGAVGNYAFGAEMKQKLLV
ncbi:MAG: methylated-DNA--[protein]-cysteine S-methyltransferase, partial [Proteobacteria bacterium]|nr:methylated-DNA--[protein]-cysteine S-methyltransferase [Pseudomonadota bacterium]